MMNVVFYVLDAFAFQEVAKDDVLGFVDRGTYSTPPYPERIVE